MKELLLRNKKALIIIVSIITTLILASTITYAIISKNKKTSVVDNIEKKTPVVQRLGELIYIEDDSISEQFETNEEKEDNEPTYLLRINKSANVVNVYTKDGNGNYTIPVKAMICSTGVYTPSCGKYPKDSYKTTGGKVRWARLEGNVYGQYATQIVGNVLFHSVPYTAQEPSALEYWAYDKLGTTASAGCIRLTVADAQWIYNNVSKGTVVEFYYDSNPGPFGKPSVRKISDVEKCRGWDPTDSLSDNPWNDYHDEEEPQEKQETQTDNINKEENKTEPVEKKDDSSENEIKNNETMDNQNTVVNEISNTEINEVVIGINKITE